uniref:ABC transporter, ATP-binding/permease n=1 Tax=uncultured bacterium contig00008 TaxID=1181500 RepID=A0A806KGD3_9BACT|nr:ABC transporter, ATP-binding/permease [uncultured bacterium contig00008]
MILPWKKGRIALVAAAGEGRRFRFFLCCAATLGTVAFSLLNPQIIRYTIDSVIGTEPLNASEFVSGLINSIGGIDLLRQNIWICAIVIILMALIAELCNLVRNYTGIEIGETVSWKLRNTLYSHIQKLPWEWHVKCQTGDIIQRCTTDVDNIRNFIQNNLSELLRTICVFLIAVAMMFSMDIYMSLIALILVPVILIFSILYFRRVSRNFLRADTAEGVMQAAAQENYTGVRVVRAFGREAYEVEKFSEKTQSYANIWNDIGKMLGLFWGAGDLLSGLQLAIIIAAGIWRCVQGDLTPGTFLAFYAYCNWMIWPVRQLGRILSDLSKTKVATDRVREILAAEPETDSPDVLCPQIKGEICFDKVNFTYGDSEPVLHDISFTLKPGQTLAILGATGSGKSSLVHLLIRLYDLRDGDGVIRVDGIDIRRISRQHLRRNIGLCLQEPFLFSKTIRENISAAFGRIETEELHSAAAVAMVHETITSFADGYDTIIGERGVTLSGGQKQRVAIARMLAGNAPVMIFDDSLSAVDTETDARIRAALRQRVKDAAVIIISHRISSLMQADKILVLKGGTVEDIGSHKELMKKDGTYRRIFDLQAADIENVNEEK